MGKKGFPTQARTPDIAMENVLVTLWPCTIKGYPNRGEPHSWSSIFEFCRDELAVHVRLHARILKEGLQAMIDGHGSWQALTTELERIDARESVTRLFMHAAVLAQTMSCT